MIHPVKLSRQEHTHSLDLLLQLHRSRVRLRCLNPLSVFALSASAFTAPLFAICAMYGTVTLVRAIVDVRGLRLACSLQHNAQPRVFICWLIMCCDMVDSFDDAALVDRYINND